MHKLHCVVLIIFHHPFTILTHLPHSRNKTITTQLKAPELVIREKKNRRASVAHYLKQDDDRGCLRSGFSCSVVDDVVVVIRRYYSSTFFPPRVRYNGFQQSIRFDHRLLLRDVAPPVREEEELPSSSSSYSSSSSSSVVFARSRLLPPLLLRCRSVQRRLLDRIFFLGGLLRVVVVVVVVIVVVVVVVVPLGHVRGGRRHGSQIGTEVREGVRAIALLQPIRPAAFQARGEIGEDAGPSDMVTPPISL